MTLRAGVVVFPGSNCEHDVVSALGSLGAEARLVWHKEGDLSGLDLVVLPGGFAHGDYLRPGAIARFSPVVGELAAFVGRGGAVLGICNGFQVLTEAGLLPGALQKNIGLRFVCRDVELRVESTSNILTSALEEGERVRIPVNHFEGCYTADADDLRRLEGEGRVVLRYLDNPNGSANDIAGISDATGRIVGLMPHPERAMSKLVGGGDGRRLLSSLLGALAAA